ncbi:Rossmann fold domain-containing protein [Qipengyuania sp. ASV99]|uniref:Rossmann fold domain-containing protein n=1 Tax=Qipengyuania sp. ASV99 TaxID=3399681 RepID=UPI003A4C7291
MQVVLEIAHLPQNGIDASADFMQNHLPRARALLAEKETAALAIVLPAAGVDYDDWRRTLARDLARAHAPKRVNVIGADGADAASAMLAYLGDAPGVTGQYLAAHE